MESVIFRSEINRPRDWPVQPPSFARGRKWGRDLQGHLADLGLGRGAGIPLCIVLARTVHHHRSTQPTRLPQEVVRGLACGVLFLSAHVTPLIRVAFIKSMRL